MGGLKNRVPERCVAVGTDSVCYITAGSGDPLVLIHGLGCSSRWWARNLEGLAREFSVFALDLPGFGGSRGTFLLDRAAEDVARWMDALGLRSASVVGHSMGGLISARLAADFPEKVRALVLCNAPLSPIPLVTGRVLRSVFYGLRASKLRRLPLAVSDWLRCGPAAHLKAARAVISFQPTRGPTSPGSNRRSCSYGAKGTASLHLPN